MAAAVCNILGIDKEDLTGKLISVEECHGSNANFVLVCLISQQIQKDCGICLVTLHNSFGHFHNVGTKLGYNLQQLEDKGSVETVEMLNLLNSSFDTSENYLFKNTEDIVKDLFIKIREKIEKLMETRKNVCLIVEDISDFLLLGIPVKDVLSFFQYCRVLLDSLEGLSVVILTHVAEGDEEQCIVATSVSHVADTVVTISSLKTGQSNDVSGVLKIVHRNLEKSIPNHDWNAQNLYHFKLLDRQVKVFAPGTAPSLT
ncbi:hypothetical protein L9F63_009171 [Diploptera punctata]|uniref:Elongator complex protein 6 n=1 Tax=Diploptera punctata TaxID=6984 RepID=A0AAD7Z4Q0_DIPPU|nr:hypothetical protein L9F63_009171 [Diploptera punctata]